MKLVRIPAGKFMMGSPETEKRRREDEGPQRQVTISRPFYMGLTEVTREQYQCVTGKNPSEFKGPRSPVEMVSWDDATVFCTALSKKTRRAVRLPTEAEWEYACRAGGKAAYGFGDDEAKLGEYAWHQRNASDKGEKHTHPVGQKKPNAFGLYDMHGNVWEWCRDWYTENFYANAKDADPENTEKASFRIVRGGSFNTYVWYCRSAYRRKGDPHTPRNFIGFRVVVQVP